jgi:TatD DNase family protein
MEGLLVDSHCHLDFDAFAQDRPAVVERARRAGVGRILNPGVDLDSSRQAVRLAGEFQEVYAAVGVHPNEAPRWDKAAYAQLKELAGHPKVVAIGEIGLDFYRERAPHDQQRLIFRQQLELAGEIGLPVVIHTRSAAGTDHPAMEEALAILSEWVTGQSDNAGAGCRGVFHSYSADLVRARRAIELGFSLGLTGPVTYKNAWQAQQLAAGLPLEALLVETDAPFLTPQPHRGERNEPAYVRLVAEKVADLQLKSFEEVAKISTQNATRLFKW